MADYKLITKCVSPLEKRFADEMIEDVKEFSKGSMLKGERFSFEVMYQSHDSVRDGKKTVFAKVISPISEYVHISRIDQVPVRFPMYKIEADDYYISRKPGLYPDLMVPVTEENRLYCFRDELMSLWVDIEVPEDAEAGVYPVVIRFVDKEGETVSEAEFSAEIINAVLPKQEITVTQWFHSDCLASYYNVEIFGEEHWRIIGNFIKTAVKNGINMILTPIFTPALDTEVGGERPTVQLVDISCDNGKWSFGFDRLERWVKMCLELGVKYFEMAHLFTQWGAEHAPKIMATVDGEYKKIFGWETSSTGDDYREFLEAFLPVLKNKLVELNVFEISYFHLSDEPGGDKLENYASVKKVVEALLEGCKIMDALSDYSFYEKGVLNNPVVSVDHISTYIEADVKNLWAYYCCCQHTKVSNRLIAMPQARNRIIGEMFYKYDIAGFLQWGYNFYYSQFSIEPINPYICTDGEYFVPAGDAFSVYPAPDGTAYETLHLLGFTQALYDLRAMKLLEGYIGKKAVMDIVEDGIPPITFKYYPHYDEYILGLRERINMKIKECIEE